jgi:hypothetical protein
VRLEVAISRERKVRATSSKPEKSIITLPLAPLKPTRPSSRNISTEVVYFS